MTDLSPAAEAVLDAVTLARYDVPYYACPKSIDQIRSDVAAALRATADQWKNETREQPDTEFIAGIKNCIDALTEIAAELEGTND